MLALAAGLCYLPSVFAGIHVVWSARKLAWLWAFALVPFIAPLLYCYVVLTRSDGRTASGIRVLSEEALRPVREFQNASAAATANPTRSNQIWLARAASALGQNEVAAQAWGAAAEGHGEEDETVVTGYAQTLLRLERWAEALTLLEKWRNLGSAETPKITLAFARAYHGLQRNAEAGPLFKAALGKLPLLESEVEYVRYLAAVGLVEQAEALLAEMRSTILSDRSNNRSVLDARCRWAELGIEEAKRASAKMS